MYALLKSTTKFCIFFTVVANKMEDARTTGIWKMNIILPRFILNENSKMRHINSSTFIIASDLGLLRDQTYESSYALYQKYAQRKKLKINYGKEKAVDRSSEPRAKSCRKREGLLRLIIFIVFPKGSSRRGSTTGGQRA